MYVDNGLWFLAVALIMLAVVGGCGVLFMCVYGQSQKRRFPRRPSDIAARFDSPFANRNQLM